MTLENWHEAQQVDPALTLVIAGLWDGMLGKGQSKATNPPKVSQYRQEHNQPPIAQTGYPIQVGQAQGI